MKIAMIHGQNHRGSTYHIGAMLAEKLGGEVTEFFLPRDFGEFCVGCNSCFMKAKEKCPHYEKLIPINKAIKEADVIILTSPVYVYHVTGPMKAWLDHYGHQWMVHRPDVGKIYKYGENIHAVSYKTISEEMMQKIDKNTTALAAKIKSNIGHVKPGLKTRMFFNVMAKVQRGGGRVSVDADYWKAKGWTEGKRPWK